MMPRSKNGRGIVVPVSEEDSPYLVFYQFLYIDRVMQMKNSRFTYLLLLMFLYTQGDSACAALRCYARQSENTIVACSTVQQRCHRHPEPRPCPLQISDGFTASKTCPLRAEVTKTPEAYEKAESGSHRDAPCTPVSIAKIFDTIQIQDIHQPAGIREKPPDLFILQSVLRI